MINSITSMKPIANAAKKGFVRQELTKPEILERLNVRKQTLLSEIEGLEAETREPICLSRGEVNSIHHTIKEKIEKLSGITRAIKCVTTSILKSAK